MMNPINSKTVWMNIELSLLTPIIIIPQIIGKELIQVLEEMGKGSEEIFRGERLPILKTHPHSESGIN